MPESSKASEDGMKIHSNYRDQYVARLKQMNVNKEFKFACQKAVTTPLNAISDVSAEHLKDKLIKLTALTNGQLVQATENTQFQVKIWKKFKIRPRLDKKEYKKFKEINGAPSKLELKLELRQKIPKNRKGK